LGVTGKLEQSTDVVELELAPRPGQLLVVDETVEEGEG
jgi:hypothetical protein